MTPLRFLLLLLWLGYGTLYARGQSPAERLFLKADSAGNALNKNTPLYFKQSLDAAQAENNDSLQFYSLYRLGIYYDMAGMGKEALQTFTKATRFAIAAKRWVWVGKGQNSMGIVEFRAGNFTRSLQYYFDALKAAEAAHDNSLIYKVTSNIGHVYFYIDIDKAETYYSKNMRFAHQLRDSGAIMESYLNLANVYNVRGECEKAIDFYHKTLVSPERDNNLYATANSLQNMAVCEKKIGRLQEAEKDLYASLTIFEQIQDKEGIAQSYVNLGDLFLQRKQYGKARSFYVDGLRLAQELDTKQGISYAYEGLIQAEAGLGHYREAFGYSEKLSDVRDSLINTEIAEATAKVEAVYENEKKKLEIENLNQKNQLQQQELASNEAELYLQNLRLLGFGIGFVLVLVLAAVILFAYWQKQRTNRELNEKNRLIEKALDEKELLMREIHHRAKNNLQVVSGLLSLQSIRLTDEKSKDAMTDATNRVKSMALIHEQLYQPGANTEIEVKPYLMELTRSLLHSYHIHENHIRMEYGIDDIRLDVDRMIPIGIMANEILSNALKHAFGNGQEGLIRLEFSRVDAYIHLRIHDNGPGVPAGFNYETARSFGMRMIHSLAKKINAEVAYSSKNGTLVTVRVPASDHPTIHN